VPSRLRKWTSPRQKRQRGHARQTEVRRHPRLQMLKFVPQRCLPRFYRLQRGLRFALEGKQNRFQHILIPVFEVRRRWPQPFACILLTQRVPLHPRRKDGSLVDLMTAAENLLPMSAVQTVTPGPNNKTPAITQEHSQGAHPQFVKLPPRLNPSNCNCCIR
jgi:hypothetical protein